MWPFVNVNVEGMTFMTDKYPIQLSKMTVKELILSLTTLICEGSVEDAYGSPQSWLSGDNPKKVYYVNDYELYKKLLGHLYEYDKFVVSNFSRKKFYTDVEKAILRLKKDQISVTDEIAMSIITNLKRTPKDDILIVSVPISGIRLETTERLSLGLFEIFHVKHSPLPMSNDPEQLCISATMNNIYDHEFAKERANSFFTDFCRLLHFFLGKFDNKHEFRIGLPGLMRVDGSNQVYIKTDSFACFDKDWKVLSGSAASQYAETIPVDNRFFSHHQQFKELWNLYDLMSKEEPITDMQRRIINAALAIGESAMTYDLRNSVIYSCVALETLLSFDEGSLFRSSIGEQISEALAFIVGSDADYRMAIYRLTKKIYSFRSALVHGGKKMITDEYITLNHLVRQAIALIMNDEKYENIKKVQELYDFIKKMKFTC